MLSNVSVAPFFNAMPLCNFLSYVKVVSVNRDRLTHIVSVILSSLTSGEARSASLTTSNRSGPGMCPSLESHMQWRWG